MKAKLLCPLGKFGGLAAEVRGEFTIGRRGCDLNLEDPSISNRHARIAFNAAEKSWFLEDLGSTNGTWVAGIRVESPERLGPLETINFADICEFVFYVVGDTAREAAPAAKAPGKDAEADDKTIFDPNFPSFPKKPPEGDAGR